MGDLLSAIGSALEAIDILARWRLYAGLCVGVALGFGIYRFIEDDVVGTFALVLTAAGGGAIGSYWQGQSEAGGSE